MNRHEAKIKISEILKQVESDTDYQKRQAFEEAQRGLEDYAEEFNITPDNLAFSMTMPARVAGEFEVAMCERCRRNLEFGLENKKNVIVTFYKSEPAHITGVCL